MKVWASILGTTKTGYVDMKIGQEVTVFKCGSWRTVFGERATLVRTTTKHLVFETESGAIVKTAIDNLFNVVGKAEKNGYAVSLRKYEDFDDMIHHHVRYWNDKKCVFECK